jgi:hypothetical protein
VTRTVILLTGPLGFGHEIMARCCAGLLERSGWRTEASSAIDFVAREEFDFTIAEVAQGRALTSVAGLSYMDPNGQAVLARKYLGVAALAKTSGILARQLLRGQINFARMIWKFNNVYNADRQYSDHLREPRYLLPPPAERATTPPGRKELYVQILAVTDA